MAESTQAAVDGKGFSLPKWPRGPFTVSLLRDHMMFEGAKVSRQLLHFGWDFRGVQEKGLMLSTLKGGANTFREGGSKHTHILTRFCRPSC